MSDEPTSRLTQDALERLADWLNKADEPAISQEQAEAIFDSLPLEEQLKFLNKNTK